MPHPRTTATVAEHPIHAMLVPFPIVFFVSTLASDLMFWLAEDISWYFASKWLLGAGIAMALLAAIAGLIDFLGERRIRDLGVARWHLAGNLLIVLIEAINWYRRYRDVETVIFSGLVLSAIAVALMLITGWLGWEMIARHRVGIADAET